ncbi:MAG: hypothetical protein OET44_14750 [Gammaproteobacteria bacterium]|nr:hypothetical protein [Gammaproteobacteria bacterium]
MIPQAAQLLLALVLAAGSSDVGIREVKARHEQSLLSTPGVVSVGIGLAPDGEQAIMVGTSSDPAALRDKLPDTLEGYPVIVQHTGTIKAQ